MISRRAMVAGGAFTAAATQSGTTYAEQTTDLAPAGAMTLKALAESLRKAPRRRDFKTAPMILTSPRRMGSRGAVAGHRLQRRSEAIVGPYRYCGALAQSDAQFAECANLVV